MSEPEEVEEDVAEEEFMDPDEAEKDDTIDTGEDDTGKG